MKASQRCIDLVKEFEGFSAKAYLCPAGVPTIGYGSTTDVKLGQTITKEAAEKRLIADLGYCERVVEKAVTVKLSQSQFDALVSFVYNVGEGSKERSGFVRLKNGRPSSLLLAINKSRFLDVPAKMLEWNKAKGKVLAGLTRRRQAEADLFMIGISDEPMAQAVDSPDKPLLKSRTLANASTAGVVGTALAVAPAIEPAGQVVEIVQNNTQGFLIVLGIALLVFAAVAIYLKLDDRKRA